MKRILLSYTSSKTNLLSWCFRQIGAILLICSLPIVASAQTKLWDRTIGGIHGYQYGDEVNNFDYGTSTLSKMLPTSDGGYILAGTSDSDRGNDKTEDNRARTWFSNDYWVVKVDKNGSKVWDKTYGGFYNDQLATITASPEGGYLLGGYSNSNTGADKSNQGKGNNDYWIVKISANGTKEWDKTIGGLDNDLLTSLLTVPGGGYLLGGYSYSEIGADKTEANKGDNNDFWIVKVDINGNKIWDKTIGGDSEDPLSSMMATPDGGFLLGGYSRSGVNADKSTPSKGWFDYWIVKIDLNGKKEWDRTLGGSGDDRLTSMIATVDNGFLLGGYSSSEIGYDKSETNKGSFDYWIVKIDKNGLKKWDKTLGGNTQDNLYALAATPDGGFLLGGSSFSNTGIDKSEDKKGEPDYWIVKTDGNGIKTWDKTLGGVSANVTYCTFECNEYEEVASSTLTSLIANPDGTYLLGGNSLADISGDKSEDHKGFESDFWVVKIKEDEPLNTAWNMRYGGTATEGFTEVIKTADGGYLSGGYTNSGSNGDITQSSQGKNDFWIVKSDAAGRKIWDKRFGGPADDYLNTLIQTQDGGYLLAGSSFSSIGGDKTQPSRGDRDFWIVKITATGAKQWDKRYGGSGSDELKKVLQLATGDYLLAGYSNSPAGGNKSQGSRGGTDYWILKISATGSHLWDRRYGGDLNDALEGLAPALDGGFLLGGTSASGQNGDKSQVSRGGNDFWLVRVDSNGRKVWDKRFGGSGEDDLMDLGSTGTSTSNFFIAGHSSSGLNGDKSQASQGGKDFWMLKINGSGTKLWDKRFGGSQDEGLRSIILTSDGGYLLGGRSESGVGGDKTQTSRGNSDYWIVKTSSTGNLQWDQRFGGNGYEEIRTVMQTADGGFLLGGRSDSGISGDKTQPSRGASDYWLVKVAPVTTSIAAAREVTVPEEKIIQVTEIQVVAYPNPFSEQATVSFSLPETQPASLKVYDNQGREVATLFQGEAKANELYELEWKAANQASGMYLLQLQTPTQRKSQKLVLCK